MGKLVIYKASAGSGKTFKLTEEYLRLAFKIPFQRILAVTFTNKATAEMKDRINNELDKLNSGAESSYIEVLMNENRMSEAEIREKAGAILDDILQNYSRFSVGTIDSFFQRIVRGFARETGLQSGFELELDNRRVLNRVIDRVLLETGSNADLQNWLMRYADSRIREGLTWNFRKDIGRLGEEVFSEAFMQFRQEMTEKLSDRSFMDTYMSSLYGLRNRFEVRMSEIGVAGLEFIDKNGLLVSDFAYGKNGVAGYFEKISTKKQYEPGKRTLDAKDVPDVWSPKKSPKKEALINAVEGGLNCILKKALDEYRSGYSGWVSAGMILSNFYTLGILKDITKHIREYVDENNLFLLSDVTTLLSGVIGNNDAPFIYEKTGYFYRHFMIDEFQDTSRIQWQNFIPLITDSLAQNNRNILVGDVKQSIYRWRNGDWRILAGEIENDMRIFVPDIHALEFNWRSKKNIVDFNNFLFSLAPNIMQKQLTSELINSGLSEISVKELQEQIVKAYSDHSQKLPEGNQKEGGHVCVRFLKNDEKDWRQQAMSSLPDLLTDMVSRGSGLRDIAILVRNNRDGKEIAKGLMEWQAGPGKESGIRLDFISEEFLQLQESITVRLILAIMGFLVNQDDKITKAQIINDYSRYLGNLPENITDHDLFGKAINGIQKTWEEFLPAAFVSDKIFLSQLPLYELVEQLISIFKLNSIDSEIPYLTAFQDTVLDYTRKETGGTGPFLAWWEEHGDRLSVSGNDSQDAIRIMTIHKAKGLQFKFVVVPFGEWKTDHDPLHDNFLWCRPDKKPFGNLELVPVKYKADLAKSIFARDYFTEKMQAFVDNLNLLYVACTRSEEELHIFTPIPGGNQTGKDQVKSISGLLYRIFSIPSTDAGQNDVNHPGYWNDIEKIYSLGNKDIQVVNRRNSAGNGLVLEKYHVNNFKDKLRLRTYGNLFFTDNNEIGKRIDYGKLMHEIFENIIKVEDVEKAVRVLCYEGKISLADVGKLTEDIDLILRKTDVIQWFDGSWRVRNETGILLKSGQTRRPDRVMEKKGEVVVLDYKFGRNIIPDYRNQVRKYMSELSNMGYDNVRGFVWYVILGIIDEVKNNG